MAIDPNDKYNITIVVNWLRKCSDGQDYCSYCPFGNGENGDSTEADCLRKLNTTAADLLEKLAGLRK